MADEIEIEEHDVLENPRIKGIFPDLSILKKEINDYDNYDGCDESSQSSITEDSMRTAVTTTINDINQRKIKTEIKEESNIFGTKTPISTHENQKLKLQLKKPKVCLLNISSSLNKNPNFCKTCSIVFPTTESYNQHRLYTHGLPINENCDKNFECNECNVTFVNYGDLSRHRSNVHAINENCSFNDKTITGVNVMVKINETNFNSLPESNLKDCFHCDMQFETQQLLIDHLYDVLNSKKTQSSQVKPINESESKDDQNKKPQKDIHQEQYKYTDETIQDVKIFRCPICSYCFKEWDFYEAHMMKKHNVSKVKETSMVSFKPNCTFCHLQYSNYKSYNTHLHKRHKNKILQRVRKQSSNKINKVVAKKTLFDLKSQDHISHEVDPINDEMSFDNDKDISEEKLQLRTITANVKVVAHQTILFQCSQCNIHFLTNASAKDHTEHSLLDDSECTICGRLFKNKDIHLHMEQHKYSNYITVNICKGKDTQEVHKRILHKCPSCTVHFSKEGILKHHTVCKMSPSQSAYCKICDILISEDIKTSHYEEHNDPKLKPSDYEIVEFKKRNRRTFVRSHKRRKSGIPKYMFHLMQCKVCDCNILRARYKSAIHFRSLCAHFIKYVCKYCGLVFSNKSINSHRKLHQKCKDLSIRDFTFYDLKTGKKILPSIPVFPKCDSCDKHFITKFEVKRHVCNRYNYLNCPKCDMKLSQTAYDLHMPFHDLVLSNEGIIQNPTIEANPPSSCSVCGKNKINAVFSCNNCLLAFNSYDEAIEHCHMHRDLNEIIIDKIECSICDLQFDKNRYDEHKKFHEDFPDAECNHYKMDVFYFGSHNDKWLKHIFGTDCSQDTVDEILKNSIYRHETRVKMRLFHRGSSGVTVYKCEKCDNYIDSTGIHEHYMACDENISTNNEHNDNSNNSIVIFNGKEDEDYNKKIASMKKFYVLYECRMCHVVVNRKCEHACVVGDYKDCGTCGLVFIAHEYEAHIEKHKRLNSFKENFMKVILLEAKEQKPLKSKHQVSKFSGMVCDYTFYKCLNCDVCVRDYRSTFQHYCLIDAAKSTCNICDLVFDEGKLKGHLKLHDTDPYFVRDTMFIQSFSPKNYVKNHVESIVDNEISTVVSDDSVTSSKNDNNTHSERKINIYKCKCGLHYLSEATAQIHLKKCKGKIKLKQSKQNCSKCGLHFSPDVLFKHLIEHHGKKDVTFKYEVIQITELGDTKMKS